MNYKYLTRLEALETVSKNQNNFKYVESILQSIKEAAKNNHADPDGIIRISVTED